MQCITITATCYHTFSLILVWFGAICNVLPRATVKFIKQYILILKKKKTVTRGNALKIAPNQENLRENIW